jgi:hypothetical protein
MKDIANVVSQVSAFTLPGQLRDNTTSSISAGPSFSKQSSNTGGQLSEVENFLGLQASPTVQRRVNGILNPLFKARLLNLMLWLVVSKKIRFMGIFQVTL